MTDTDLEVTVKIGPFKTTQEAMQAFEYAAKALQDEEQLCDTTMQFWVLPEGDNPPEISG